MEWNSVEFDWSSIIVYDSESSFDENDSSRQVEGLILIFLKKETITKLLEFCFQRV